MHALFTITRPQRRRRLQCRAARFRDGRWRISNIIFRIPTPIFGARSDRADSRLGDRGEHGSERAPKNASASAGGPNFAVAGRTISGQPNRNGNDGTIARFGWKAQNKSLLLFCRRGLQRRDGHQQRAVPDRARRNAEAASSPTSPEHVTQHRGDDGDRSDQRHREVRVLHALPGAAACRRPDTPGGAPSIASGKAPVHRRSAARSATRRVFTTGNAAVAALAQQAGESILRSAGARHGRDWPTASARAQAGPREFRTAPLWGLGQRLFFLHDGRTSDLRAAIRAHQSNGSEANAVINNLQASERKQQAGPAQFPAVAVGRTPRPSVVGATWPGRVLLEGRLATANLPLDGLAGESPSRM